jgi:hypothetical protein
MHIKLEKVGQHAASSDVAAAKAENVLRACWRDGADDRERALQRTPTRKPPRSSAPGPGSVSLAPERHMTSSLKLGKIGRSMRAFGVRPHQPAALP